MRPLHPIRVRLSPQHTHLNRQHALHPFSLRRYSFKHDAGTSDSGSDSDVKPHPLHVIHVPTSNGLSDATFTAVVGLGMGQSRPICTFALSHRSHPHHSLRERRSLLCMVQKTCPRQGWHASMYSLQSFMSLSPLPRSKARLHQVTTLPWNSPHTPRRCHPSSQTLTQTTSFGHSISAGESKKSLIESCTGRNTAIIGWSSVQRSESLQLPHIHPDSHVS